MKMKSALCLGILFLAISLQAQLPVFTYQGRLLESGTPASGTNYNMQFYLYDAATNGSQLGNLYIPNVTITNGVFTVPLGFGDSVFDGNRRWLEIRVQKDFGGSVTLSPRQEITSTPYAIQAANAATAGVASSAGSVAAASITGALTIGQLPASILTNGASGVNISGTFSGDGSGVTNVDLFSINSQGAITFQTNGGKFILASSPSVGDLPVSVMSADVNGDGKVDLISANGGNGTLSVLTNTGSGSFVISSSPGVDGSPWSVTSADVNGDGKADLICANIGANTLSVLTNSGNGGFVLSSTLSVGNQPESVTAADVNGDGKVDLISGNYFGHTLTVLTNNGSGGFVLSSTLSGIPNPQSVTSADVNGDGKADLICSSINTLRVLTNNGSGGFVLSSSPSVGHSPVSVTAADVNGDGKVDLISANAGPDTLSVLTNNGSGGFVLSSSPSVSDGPFFVTAADVNGDDKVDLITANIVANTLSVLTNNGSGGFVLSSSPGVGTFPQSLTAVDVNGDGKVDLISTSSVYVTPTLSVLINTPVGFAGEFTGDGAGLTTLNASQLTSGTVKDARLSRNVPLLNGTNVFTGTNRFSGVVIATNLNNQFTGAFTGNGGSLTNLNAAQLAGTISTNNIAAGSITASSFDSSIGVWTVSGTNVYRLTGNVGIGTSTFTSNRLQVVGMVGATAFNSTSDRAAKQDFAPVNAQDILAKVSAMPITQWSFTEFPGNRHIGPMAQDFYSAFGLGTDDKHIATVDADGVALAAIQGLNQKLEEQTKRADEKERALHTLQKQNAALEKRLADLEKLVDRLAK